jgi:hypothetical protein
MLMDIMWLNRVDNKYTYDDTVHEILEQSS